MPADIPFIVDARAKEFRQIGRTYDTGGSTRLLLWSLFLDGNRRVELPLTCWQKHDGAENPEFPLLVPPRRPCLINRASIYVPGPNALYGTTHTNGPLLVLSDSIAVADEVCMGLSRTSPGVSPISWYGGMETIDRIVWGLMRHNHVIYPVCNHSGFGRKEAFETARRVREKLVEQGADVTVVDCYSETEPAGGSDGSYRWCWGNGGPRIVGPDELSGGGGPVAEAGRLDVARF